MAFKILIILIPERRHATRLKPLIISVSRDQNLMLVGVIQLFYYFGESVSSSFRVFNTEINDVL